MPVIKVFGVPEAIRNIEQLPIRLRNKHMRIALNAGAGLIRDAAKPFVPVDSGLLKKSLAVKVKIPQASTNSDHWDKPSYAVIGVRRRSGKFLARTKKGRLRGYGNANRELKRARAFEVSGQTARQREVEAVRFTRSMFPRSEYRNPSRYAHLVEKGTKRTHARPFLQPAVAIAGAAAGAKIVAKLNAAVHAEAAALAAT